jgi:hypothetical protein
MKRILILIAVVATLAALACKKDEVYDDLLGGSGTEVPAQLQGNWMYGNFSMTDYWSQNPSDYIGNALEFAIAFRFYQNGAYEQYFTSSSVTSGVKTYQQSVTKGTVVLNETNKTITTYPAKAHYKRTSNGHTVEERDPAKNELSAHTTYQYSTGVESSGTKAIYLTMQGTNSSLTFLKKP